MTTEALRYDIRVDGHTLGVDPMTFGPQCTSLAEAKTKAAEIAAARNSTVTVVRVAYWKGYRIERYRKVASFDRNGKLQRSRY